MEMKFKMRICEECSGELPINKKRFCTEACRNKNKYKNNKEKYNKLNYKSQKKRRKNKKLELIELKGGKCELCGYNKCQAALSFHHISEKNISMDATSMTSNTFSKILKELDLCQLLCMNCHSELHNPEYDMSIILENYS